MTWFAGGLVVFAGAVLLAVALRAAQHPALVGIAYPGHKFHAVPPSLAVALVVFVATTSTLVAVLTFLLLRWLLEKNSRARAGVTQNPYRVTPDH